MKTISNIITSLTLGLAFLITTPLHAQIEEPDTILKITTPTKVILTENADGTNVEVRTVGEQDDIIASVLTEYSSESSVRTKSREGKLQQWWHNRNLLDVSNEDDSHWGVSVDGVCIGLNNAVNQTPENGLQWSKSFEISWLSCLNVYYEFNRSKISLGLGFDWRNYKITTSDKCLTANEDKGIEWGIYPEGSKGRFSRLKVFSLQLPLLYEWDIPKSSVTFKAGPILNFNTYASLKSVWDDADGNRRETFTKNISPRRCTIDFFASISFCKAIGIYVRYSPMKVMDSPNTINFQPLTVGLGFGI